MDPHDLYGLPFDRFVSERTALSRELRQAGRRDEAEAVGKLRKPSLSAWAVNQLVRTQRRAVGGVFAAGDAAQRAQADLLAGRHSGEALRDALAREREAVGDLVEVARGLLTSEGHELSSTTLERVADTLHAAALDEEARSQVETGCLERELRHVGLGPMAEGAVTPRGKRSSQRASRSSRPAPRSSRPATRSSRPAPQSSRQAKPSPDLAALRRAEGQARRALDRAARDAETAQARRDAATDALREAERDLTAATKRLREAEVAHRDAEKNLRSA